MIDAALVIEQGPDDDHDEQDGDDEAGSEAAVIRLRDRLAGLALVALRHQKLRYVALVA